MLGHRNWRFILWARWLFDCSKIKHFVRCPPVLFITLLCVEHPLLPVEHSATDSGRSQTFPDTLNLGSETVSAALAWLSFKPLCAKLSHTGCWPIYPEPLGLKAFSQETWPIELHSGSLFISACRVLFFHQGTYLVPISGELWGHIKTRSLGSSV